MPFASPGRLRREIENRIPERPFTIEFWDGTRLPATGPDGPTFYVRSPRAAAHVLRAPGQLGLGRAYVSGDIEVDDMDAVIEVLDSWKPPPLAPADKSRLLLGTVRAAGLTRPPRRPASELRPSGHRHTKERDARAVRHHYDVSNEFFSLFLDESMTYSCAIFSHGAETLEAAQEEKLETVCRKLRLTEGDRVLDVGCGWGSFPLWAATRHGAHVVGITLSSPQAAKARERAAAAGVADRVEIRVMDYRDLAGERFDAIASIGMVEHVGAEQIDVYARTLAGLLDTGGACSTTASPAFATPIPTPGRSRSATSFPMPTHCTSRAYCLPWKGPVSSPAMWRSSPPTTPKRCVTGRGSWTTTWTRRFASPALNGSASGGSTCAPPATASNQGLRRSTRPAAPLPERSRTIRLES
ncbi:MAG: cyclopropane-fatty-acyl-phospholipid synthase family protein [Solirubrobacterales bacterium]